jgi:hypothetical protein
MAEGTKQKDPFLKHLNSFVYRTFRILFLTFFLAVLILLWYVLLRELPLPGMDSGLLGFLYVSVMPWLLLYVLFVLFNFVRLVTLAEHRRSLTARKVFWKPKSKKIPPLRQPQSSTPLAQLPPWLPLRSHLGHWLVTYLIIQLSVVLFTFILFFPFYYTVIGEFPGGGFYLACLFLVPLFVFMWNNRVRTLTSRIVAFVGGPSLGPRSLNRRSLLSVLIASLLTAGGIFELRGSEAKVLSTVLRMYLALWAVVIGIIVLRMSTQQLSAVFKTRVKSGGVRLQCRWNAQDSRRGTGKSRVIFHLTDLHLTGPSNAKSLSPANCPDKRTISGEAAAGVVGSKTPGQIWSTFRGLLSKHYKELQDGDAILISGDITDTGDASEWMGFFDAFQGFESLLPKIVIVPGNHDVNVCHVLRSDDSASRHANINRIRFLAAADMIQGERATVFPDSGPCTLRVWGAQFTEGFRKYITNPPTRTSTSTVIPSGDTFITVPRNNTPPEVEELFKLPEEAWIEAFPMIVRVGDPPVSFLVLDSNMLGTTIFNNAFGEIGKRQISRIRNILDSTESPVIISLHHHMGNPPEEALPTGKDAWFDRALTLLNPVKFLESLPPGKPFVVFNGHRHLGYTGIVDDRITIISGPSTTLGDAKKKREERQPQIGVYELWWKENGDIDCFSERWL